MSKLRMAMYYGDKPNTGQYDNGCWLDILKIPFIRTVEDAADYDVIIRTMWFDGIGWSKEIRSRYPHVKQIGLSDHPLSSQVSRMPAPQQVAYIQELEQLDGVMVLTEEEREWYQTAVPSRPVVKVGLPFPFEQYEKDFGHLKGSEKKYIGLGVGASDTDRNFISNVLIFNRLRLTNPDLVGVFLSVPQNLMAYCSVISDNFENIYIQQREGMGAYYDVLSQCKLVINLADRNTPGRLQGEAAFFGVPVVGSNRFELQNEIFPALSVSPYALQAATSHAERLLSDEVYATTLADQACVKLQKYNYSNSKRKFNKLLNQIRG